MVTEEDWSREPDIDGLRIALDEFEVEPLEGERRFIVLAEKGSALSMAKLGYIYSQRAADRGGPDLEAAENWYLLAIRAGNKMATYNLGTLHLRHKNYMKAKEAFESGGKMNYGPSVFNLGRLYTYGIGVEKNSDLALALYKRAASLGNIWGKLAVATMTVTLGKGALEKIKGIIMVIIAGVQFRVQKWRDPRSERLIK